MQSYLFCLLLLALPFSLFAMSKEAAHEPKIIILLGPPASGKGTQSIRLAKEFQIPAISTGELFRENMKNDTQLGKKAKQFIEQGKLVPDEIVLDMLFDRLKQPDTTNGFILDGFPRTIAQAEALSQRLGANSDVIALNLNVSDDTIIKRTAGRLMCKQCGNVHNRYFSPPSKEGACDKCSGELYQRNDDKPEVVITRLQTYHEQTEPLIAYYKSKNLLVNVEGEQDPEKVFRDLKEAVLHCPK